MNRFAKRVLVILAVFVLFIYCTIYFKKDRHNAKPSTVKVTDQVFLEISFDKEVQGKIIIGLFGDVVPKTVKNFIAFAQGFQINGAEKFLTYKGSKFHRVVKSFMIQGGDVLNRDGTGGISLFGKTFPDENFLLKHSDASWVSMANSGPDTNSCQFFITLVPTPWLDKHHVVFGKVMQGMDVVYKISQIKTNSIDVPDTDINISNSGLLEIETDIFVRLNYTISK